MDRQEPFGDDKESAIENWDWKPFFERDPYIVHVVPWCSSGACTPGVGPGWACMCQKGLKYEVVFEEGFDEGGFF